MTFAPRPATPADLNAAWALCFTLNASLTADCGLEPDSWARPDGTAVDRDGVTWYGVTDVTSMPYRGWVADAPSAGIVGVALTDLDVTDPAVDLSGVI